MDCSFGKMPALDHCKNTWSGRKQGGRITFCSDAHFVLCVVFEKTLDTTTGKLEHQDKISDC